MDFSKFDFVVTSDPTKHRLLDLFEVWLVSGDENNDVQVQQSEGVGCMR